MAQMRRVVITGLGLATPLGLEVDENWQKLLKGTSGIGPFRMGGFESFPIRAVGEIDRATWLKIQKRFPVEATEEGERRTLFALWSAASALQDAGLSNAYGDRNRYGMATAAGLGKLCFEDILRWTTPERESHFAGFLREWQDMHPESSFRNNANRPASLISKRFCLHGPNLTLISACASATQAIGMAYRRIAFGEADLMVAGGADSMVNPTGVSGFLLLKAASVSRDHPQKICRPFDGKRSGLVVSEGAGFAVIEELSHALQRGAPFYAEIAGYATTLDAYRMTAPHPEGRGAEQAMRLALKDAELNYKDIDYINAHATGTRLNDVVETLAIKRVFKERAPQIPISASKSMIGHLMAACGGPEFIYTVMSVYKNEIHPTINLVNPDPDCDLDYVPNVKRKTKVRAALSNSFGFGGQNAVIAIKKYVP